MRRLTLALFLAAFSNSCASAQEAPSASEPPGQVNPPGGNATATPLTGEANISQILDALHARGVGLRDFTGDVSLSEKDTLTGDTTTFLGKVWYQALGEKDSRLRVLFNQRKVGQRPPQDFKQEYMLNQGWLIERDFKNKNEIRRQVLEEGQKINLLKLGEGPFPLPIGQTRESVLEQFAVEKVTDEAKALPGTVHILLKPKEGTRFARKFDSFDVWVDSITHFPKRIQTRDPRRVSVKTTDFANILVNQGLDQTHFTLEPIGPDWNRRSERMVE